MNKKRKRPNHLIIKDMIESGHSFVFCLKDFKRSPKVLPDSIHLHIDDFDIIYDVDIEYGNYTIYGHYDNYDSFATNKTILTPFDLETGRIIVGFDKETGRVLLDGGMSKSSFKRQEMTQQIKEGDYVYIPSESLKPIKCFYDEDNECLRINFDDINAHVWFDENGCLIGKLDKTNIPLLWLATPENKAKIEQFYGCKLENPPTFRMATLTIPHDNS